MLFEDTIKQLRWYLKGQIATWGVWIIDRHYDSETLNGIEYAIRVKEISIPDSKANREKSVLAVKKSYAELGDYTPPGKWMPGERITSALSSARTAHYIFSIQVNEGELAGKSLEWLWDKARAAASYQPSIYTEPLANGGSKSVLSHFEIGRFLSVEISNSGSWNKGQGGVDIFPYEYASIYIDEPNGTPYVESSRLVESECNHYVRGVLLKEVAVFIEEIMRAKMSGKRPVA